MEELTTLSQRMNQLKKEGYTEEFCIKDNQITNGDGDFFLAIDQVNVDNFYRFEGMSDPADSSILYAISTNDKKIKGVIVNAYSIYSDPETLEFMKKLESSHIKNIKSD